MHRTVQQPVWGRLALETVLLTQQLGPAAEPVLRWTPFTGDSLPDDPVNERGQYSQTWNMLHLESKGTWHTSCPGRTYGTQ